MPGDGLGLGLTLGLGVGVPFGVPEGDGEGLGVPVGVPVGDTEGEGLGVPFGVPEGDGEGVPFGVPLGLGLGKGVPDGEGVGVTVPKTPVMITVEPLRTSTGIPTETGGTVWPFSVSRSTQKCPHWLTVVVTNVALFTLISRIVPSGRLIGKPSTRSRRRPSSSRRCWALPYGVEPLMAGPVRVALIRTSLSASALTELVKKGIDIHVASIEATMAAFKKLPFAVRNFPFLIFITFDLLVLPRLARGVVRHTVVGDKGKRQRKK